MVRHVLRLVANPDLGERWTYADVRIEHPEEGIRIIANVWTRRLPGRVKFWAETISHESLHLALIDVEGEAAGAALDNLVYRHGYLLEADWGDRWF